MKKEHVFKGLGSGLLIGALLSTNGVEAKITAEDLGQAEVLQAKILKAIAKEHPNAIVYELRCGEGKCGEGKCGEGKCGGHAKTKATTKSKAQVGKVQKVEKHQQHSMEKKAKGEKPKKMMDKK